MLHVKATVAPERFLDRGAENISFGLPKNGQSSASTSNFNGSMQGLTQSLIN